MLKPISKIPMLSDDEYDLIVRKFNDTQADYPKDKCVHQLFEEQVLKIPNKEAVIACDKTLTYRELNEQANRIAHSLIEKGIKPNDIVAFMLPRKSYLLSVMFGILKSGAAYMPIDPDYPQDRIEYMLSDSGAKFCITEDNINDLFNNTNISNLDIHIDQEHNFCVIYTSGSTGQPKGCYLKHKGIVNFCVNNNVMEHFKSIDVKPVGISVNNVTFDYFIAENIVLLLNGYKMVLCSKEQSTNIKDFWALCEKHKVNLIQTTPTRYDILLQKEFITSSININTAVTSGEPLTSELYIKIKQCIKATIFNPMGPTECSVWVPGGKIEDQTITYIGKTKYISEFKVCSKKTNRLIWNEFNNTEFTYPKGKCVHTLFEEQATKIPDKEAVIACDKILTYRDLNEQANRIAHSLIEKSIKPNDIVAFMLPRKSYLLSVMFGILKSGAAYMPIDPDYPKDRIEYMLSDSGAKICITEDNIGEYLSNDNTENPDVEMTSEDLCYCIYTSGSTGKPKGTVIKHRNVINFCTPAPENHFTNKLVNSCDLILATNSVSFDIVLQEIHIPLLNGLSVLLSESSMTVGEKEIDVLNHHSNLGLITTPVKMNMMLDNADFVKTLDRFKLIMVGADVLTKSLVDRIAQHTSADIINGYGPTETTCGSIYSENLMKEKGIDNEN